MKKFFHYQQHDQMDCGPACLRIVAKHYGRYFTAQSLRERVELSKEGVSLLGIAEAAEAIGFRSLGVQISFEKLMHEVQLPCIVHWQQNHFVVVYDIKPYNYWMRSVFGGFRPSVPTEVPLLASSSVDFGTLVKPLASNLAAASQGTVYVADPAQGLLTYTAEEFCAGWLSTNTGGQSTGIALLLEPTPALHQHEDEVATDGKYSFGRVLNYLAQHRGLLLQVLLGLAVGSVLQLLVPFLTQSVVDVGVNTHNIPFVYLVLGA